MNYAIVILNKYPELAHRLISSIQRTHTNFPTVLVVCDKHREQFPQSVSISTTDDFIFARNANRGIDTFPTKDIILCNDDTECIQDDFFHRLSSIANKYPLCGIMSPLIDGGVGNPLQQYPEISNWREIPVNEIAIQGTDIDAMPVCFPCVYIKRNLISRIGSLDEKMEAYGFDDNDYCIRARQAGFLTMITRGLKIKHGTGGCTLKHGYNWSCSFAKSPQQKTNQEYFLSKHTRDS